MAEIVRPGVRSVLDQIQTARAMAMFREVLAVQTNRGRTPADLTLVVASVRRRFGWRGSIDDAEELLVGSGEFQLLRGATTADAPLVTERPERPHTLKRAA